MWCSMPHAQAHRWPTRDACGGLLIAEREEERTPWAARGKEDGNADRLPSRDFRQDFEPTSPFVHLKPLEDRFRCRDDSSSEHGPAGDVILRFERIILLDDCRRTHVEGRPG